MTSSSKSPRARRLASSFSLSSLRSKSLKTDDACSPRPPSLVLRPDPYIVPIQQPVKTDSTRGTGSPTRSIWEHDSDPDIPPKIAFCHKEPVSPFPLTPKTRSWGDRISSLLPSLISSSADPYNQPITRKPLASKPSLPAEHAPGFSSYPPIDLDARPNPSAVRTLNAEGPPKLELLGSYTARDAFSYPPVPPSDWADAAISQERGGIPHSATMPLATETKRATLFKQQPANVPPPQARMPPPDADDGAVSPRSGRLRKENRDFQPRRSSLQQPMNVPAQPGLPLRTGSPNADPRGRSISAHPPSARTSTSGTRIASTPVKTRPASPGNKSPSPSRGRVRRSWLPGRSRSNSVEPHGIKSYAWIMSEDVQAEYNPGLLKNQEKIPELWNENGTVVVYLSPNNSGMGPSFKVPEHVISSSSMLSELIQVEAGSPSSARSGGRSFDGRANLTAMDAARFRSPQNSPPVSETSGECRLYLPPQRPEQLAAPSKGSDPELDRLIGIRNLFAFLTGQPLVGTRLRPTFFLVFLNIANLLEEFDFVGPDGTGFGEHVDACFGYYLDLLRLSDCRSSREKTVEALILGERMRSAALYNEAYAHAAGKYSAIMDLRMSLYTQVSSDTRQRLERSHLDLINRQHNVNEHLEQFEFPALFAGIASSASIPELRPVRFKMWKNSFSKMRQLVLGFYKTEFGNWPPKASSKKNPFAESGLNRIVLKMLYKDMCDLYDLLVDRSRLTTRVMDHVPKISGATDDPNTVALHSLLSEFDRSKPPVLPPVPFDLPIQPSMATILPTYYSLPAREQAKFDKKVKDHELELILTKAYNYDAITRRNASPFLEEFRKMELREAKGKASIDIVDQRFGYWVFLYVVIQSLPMLVVDAPDLRHSGDTEYFLCQPPMGNLPWMDDRQVRKMWYGVAGGGGMVELSTDTVMFSVEGTYHRSHCWLAANNWDAANGPGSAAAPVEQAVSPLQPPQSIFQDQDAVLSGPISAPSPTGSPPPWLAQPAMRRQHLSPVAHNVSRSSVVLGLEPVPLEPPPSRSSQHQPRSSSLGPYSSNGSLGNRSASAGDLAALNKNHARKESKSKLAATSGATFDDILGSTDKVANKKKSKFF